MKKIIIIILILFIIMSSIQIYSIKNQFNTYKSISKIFETIEGSFGKLFIDKIFIDYAKENVDRFYLVYKPVLKVKGKSTLNYSYLNESMSFMNLDGEFYDVSNEISTRSASLLLVGDNPEISFNISPDTISTNSDSFSINEGKLSFPDTKGPSSFNMNVLFDNESLKGSLNYSYDVYIDDELDISILNESVYQGDAIPIKIKNLDEFESLTINSSLNDYQIQHVYDESDYKVAIFPVHYSSTLGDHQIIFNVTYPNGAKKTYKKNINVLDSNFEIQYLEVTEETGAIINNDNYLYDSYYMAKAFIEPNENSYIEGTFIKPVEGSITTEYGYTRYVNGENPYTHTGIDIAANYNVPIKASNSGIVTLSHELKIRGNTIVIYHGYGIYSVYYHLNELGLSQGDIVEKGDIIGKVGSTGFSTGPHLHFAMYVNDHYLSPWYFFENEVITK